MVCNFRDIKTFFLACGMFLSFIGIVLAQEHVSNYQAKVLSVESGNSLVLQIDKRKLSVTFFGIGSVEVEQPTGKESLDTLSRLLKGKQVVFVPSKQLDLTKEQVSTGKVLLDEQDIVLKQLSKGLAYVTKEGRGNLTDEDKTLYEQAEQSAFEKRLGLWSEDYRCESDPNKDKTGGLAEIEVLIDESGNVIKAKALCGNPMLRSAAIKAALDSKFKPTTLAGLPVKVTGKIKYNFAAQSK